MGSWIKSDSAEAWSNVMCASLSNATRSLVECLEEWTAKMTPVSNGRELDAHDLNVLLQMTGLILESYYELVGAGEDELVGADEDDRLEPTRSRDGACLPTLLPVRSED